MATRRAGSRAFTTESLTNLMPRSAKAARIARDVSGDGGTGKPNGITTEISTLLAFLVGALCVWNRVEVAAAVSVAALLLLALKDWLHRLAQRIESSDVEATLKFAIITVIILPLLPNQAYGPPSLEAINPYQIWLMVVLISGLNFVGYILVKVLGSEHGIGLTGILGGLVSSTAVTLGFAQRSRAEPKQSPALVLASSADGPLDLNGEQLSTSTVSRCSGFRSRPGAAGCPVESGGERGQA